MAFALNCLEVEDLDNYNIGIEIINKKAKGKQSLMVIESTQNGLQISYSQSGKMVKEPYTQCHSIKSDS